MGLVSKTIKAATVTMVRCHMPLQGGGSLLALLTGVLVELRVEYLDLGTADTTRKNLEFCTVYQSKYLLRMHATGNHLWDARV